MRVNKRKIIYGFFFAGICFYAQYALASDRYLFTSEDRDPFMALITSTGRVLVAQQMTLSNLVLKGIIYSPEKKLAVINDEIFKEDDSVGDYIVETIEEKRVILKKGDKEIILKLEEE